METPPVANSQSTHFSKHISNDEITKISKMSKITKWLIFGVFAAVIPLLGAFFVFSLSIFITSDPFIFLWGAK